MRTKVLVLVSFVSAFISPCFALSIPEGLSKVDQVYGDFDKSIYHDGFDLPGELAQTVISPISSGVVLGYNNDILGDSGYVCVRDYITSKIFVFGHIQPTTSTFRGDFVSTATILGALQRFPESYTKPEYCHLHIAIAANSRECFITGAEDPLPHFSPVTQALTLNASDIIPVPDKSTAATAGILENMFSEFPVQGVEYTGIYGDVDIIVHAQNNVNGGNRSGVYQLDWSLIDGINETILFSGRPFSMYGVMIPTNTSRTTTYLSPPTRDPQDGSEDDWQNYYNVTNVGQQLAAEVQFDSNVEENSWKTADYPDTVYQVKVIAYPYPAGTPPAPVEAVRNVAVDNYRPYAQEVDLLLKSGETETSKYHVKWATSAVIGSMDTLVPGVLADQPLIPGEYKAVITFSEYVNAPTAQLTGGPAIVGDLHDDPSIHKTRLEGNLSLQLQDYPQDAQVQLLFNGTDKTGNGLLGLTVSSATISITNELRRAANGFLPGTAGTDSFHTLRIEVTQPMITRENSSGILDNACMGVCSTEDAPVYFTSNRVRFGYSDLGSGIASVKLYRDSVNPANQIEVPLNVEQNYVFEKTHDLPDGKYVQVVTDKSGKITTMWFRVDPVTPRIALDHIDMARDFSGFSIYGVAQDTGSGMGFLRLTRDGEIVRDFELTPGTIEQISFSESVPAIGSETVYLLSAQDRAQNSVMPQPRAQFHYSSLQTGEVMPGGGDDYHSVGRHITGISMRGVAPCTVTLTAVPTTLPVPVNYQPTTNSISVTLNDSTDTPVGLFSGNEYMSGSLSVGYSAPSCIASVTQETVAADIVGPAVSVSRNSSEPTGLDVTYNFGMFEPTFHNLVTLEGATPELTVVKAAAPAPKGYALYPFGTGLGWRLTYTGVYYSGITIRICGLPSGLSEADLDRFEIYQYKDDGTVGGLDTTRVEGCVTAETGSNSIFALAAPISIYDQSGPEVYFSASRVFVQDETVYVSSTAQLSLTSVDLSSNTDVLAGVASTYYLLGAEPTAECLSTAYNPAAAPGTCENPLYTGAFNVPEGVRSLYRWAVDEIGNVGPVVNMALHSDGTTPAATLAINGAPITAGATVYATTADTITLTAEDIMSNGLASGWATTYFLVDVSTDNCGFMDWFGGVNDTGTCENPYYSGPFTLSPGEHFISIRAQDNVGNQEATKTAYFVVSEPVQTYLPITPSSGPIGVPFTIEGAGFGTYSAGTTVVLLGGTTAPLTLWTDTKIQGTIPGALAAGQHPVVVKRGTEVLTEVSPFTITQPALYSLTPSSGAIGLPFTITGESFGNYVAGFTRVLLGGATMPLTLWTDTKIQGTIPGTLPVGDYELVVERALNGGVVRTSTTTFSLRNMEAYWLAPSSGPIGMPFTITGVGFGNYSSVYTHVLIGDATAPLTLWTDTKIQGTVPGSLASGQYPVLVERRTSDGGAMQTSPMTFEVVNVDVASMTPVAGPIGMPFTIYGGNFGNYVANYTRVLIGGTTCPLTLWTADKIQGTIPGALGPGEYPVIVERELNGGIVQSSALAFTVSTPTAYNISPASGPIGVPFTINGESFGNYSAAYTGVLINGATVPLTLWTDTKIQGTIPGNLAPGQYPVMVGRMTADGGMVGSNPLTFEVVGVNVASMTPVSGPIAMPFTIYGTGFGNYSAGYTKVLIGGTTCPLTLWTDTKLQGTVPGSLAAGDYQVLVERSLNGGQVQSLPLAFGVTAPVAYTLAPSSGPIGLPFTIMGSNFGNYVANYTKVLIGGAAAPLTLWTDTKLQGTIPGSLADGDHEVVVERALNGGVVRTSTFTFTVGTPYMDTVSPSTASIIAPFTITGYNFGNYVANYTKVLINGTTAPLTLWTDTKIQGKLPFLLAGTYPVQVQRYLNGGLAESATAYINVEEPVISSMTPTSGAVGTVFNLYGTGFGPYDATIAKVFLGGTQCALSLWTDTRITGTVPSGLTYGTHTVVAMRGQAVSNGLEFYIPGTYSPSMMRPGLSPSALEFKLGEVYVYPDPAKGGKVPTFHIEVGTADSVKLKVFTVAGQLTHEQTLMGSPQAVGSVYAYEYAWTGRIASGVYYYTVEAERAGKKLKAKGKFAVVR